MAIAKLGKKKKLTKEELEAKKVILRIFTVYPDLIISKLSIQAESEGKLNRNGLLVASNTAQPGATEEFIKMIDNSENEDEFEINYVMTFGIKEPITGKLIEEAEYSMKTNIKFEDGVTKLSVIQNSTFSVKDEVKDKYKYLFELIGKENEKIKTLNPDELVKYTNE